MSDYTIKPGYYSLRLTSEEWYNTYYKDRVTILDFDGWDRSAEGWNYSWNEELITRSQFEQRLCESTIQWDIEKV